MKQRKLLLGVVVFLLGSAVPVAAITAGTLRQQLEKGVTATVAVEKETADLRQDWQLEKRQLAEETHNLELEAKLLAARSLKLAGYRQQRQQEIQKLENGLAEMAEIGLRLEPYLDELAQKIETLVAADLPFSRIERQRRLLELNQVLDSYDADLAEKLRRSMEVLKIEAGFGRGFEVDEELLPLNGVDTTVRVLRLGRVGLYYLTLDGSQAGWYNREKLEWEALPGSYSESVKEALRMALKQRAFDLVRLPVAGGGQP